MLSLSTYCRILLFFFYLSSGVRVTAQKRENREDLKDFRTTYYKLKEAAAPLYSIPVSGIVLHDARNDTSYIGLIKKESSPQFICLKKGWPDIQKYYSSLIVPGNEKGLLHCFIRKLLLTDHITMDWKELKATKIARGEKSGVFIVAEFYEQLDSIYYPFYRFDTLISDIPRLHKNGENYLLSAFRASLQKASNLNWSKVHEKASRLTTQQIDSFNTSRSLLPALTELPVKGVYFTYDEFRNNKPHVFEFFIKKDRNEYLLYSKNQNGEEKEEDLVWGYCDGKDKYIRSAGHFFKLHRTGNGYTLYGAKRRREKFIPIPVIVPTAPSGGAFLTGATNITYLGIDRELFHLDLDTGNIY